MIKKNVEKDLVNCDFVHLYELANNGNADALELLREHYHDIPELPLLLGNLATLARDSRMKQMMGGEAPGTALTFQEKMKDVEKQVAGDNPTSLEKLLAERIAMCWLDVQDHEYRYSQLGDSIPNRYEWQSRMLDRAHGRDLSAIKALAYIRRLHLSIVQVNIADKQINTVGSGTLALP